MEYVVKIIRSKRKTLSLEVTPDLQIILRAPYWVKDRDIDKFVKEREGWIRKSIAKVSKKQEEQKNIKPISLDEVRALKKKAAAIIPPRVEYYADIIGVNYGRITIRCQKTVWGSCSFDHNLNFNCLLMLVPEPVLDYVIVHELCHILELNHSRTFWNHVASVLPDYKKRRNWLKTNGSAIIASVRNSEH